MAGTSPAMTVTVTQQARRVSGSYSEAMGRNCTPKRHRAIDRSAAILARLRWAFQLATLATSRMAREYVTEYQSSMPHNWDVEADVVVVGFGAAGFAASVTAHDLGAKVVILEKAPEGQEGGNTRVAGQGYLNTSSVEQAIAYLTALCGPYTVPATMVEVWAEEMCKNNAWLAGLGADP